MFDQLTLPERLSALLGHPLPGPEAQLLLAPQGRNLPDDPLENLAAVLIALVYHKGEWHFPLIHRVEDGYVHGGQIGLPGGRKEGYESPEETAIREAYEEVSIDPAKVTLLGRLSPLPVPVSQTQVMPIVGKVDGEPCLTPDPKEVQSVFLVALRDLLAHDAVQRETRIIKGNSYEIPYFTFQGHQVWGATAMILGEFRQILQQL